MTLRLALYLRISKDEQSTHQATARQEQACRTLASARGWEIAEVFEDVDLSAYQPGVHRPAYERMLSQLATGLVDGVLVWKLDRLVRRPSEFERFWAACEKADGVLVSATEPIDSTFELGLAIVRILVTFASLESATIGVRLQARNEADARAGKLHGPKSFGYTVGYRAVVAEEASLIREAARRVLAGEGVHRICRDWPRKAS